MKNGRKESLIWRLLRHERIIFVFKLYDLTICREENKKINWLSSMKKKANLPAIFLFKTVVT